MSCVSSLYRLQQIDLSLDRAHARIEEIDQTLADEEEILQKKKTLETKKGKLEAARKAHLLKERERLTMEIGRCEAEREAAVSDVTAEDLKLYESLRKRFSGMVVTLERDSSCSACGVELARSIRQEIRTGDDLIRCRQCGRILYAG
ncbi:MAG: C4-type zinc ribbon domain-containing protein [Anaerolineales bacterium]